MTGTITSGGRSLPREALLERAARAAQGLAGLGVGEGDAVALLLRNDIPFLEATLAVRMVGGYAVPINWHSTSEEAGYILKDSSAKVVVVHADLMPALEGPLPAGEPGFQPHVLAVETPPEIRRAYGLGPAECAIPSGVERWEGWLESHPALAKPAAAAALGMIYTSGTTGRPKGVRRDPAGAEQNAIVLAKYQQVFGIHPEMRSLIPAPMYHSAPNAYALFSMLTGGDLRLLPRFEPEPFLALLAEHRITHVQMVPAMFVRLLKLPGAVRRRYDVSALQHVVHAAAPCPVEVKRAMIEWWGPVIYEYYGGTESGAITFSTSQEWLARPGTVGSAMKNCTLKILDEQGAEVPQGAIGEIYMRDAAMPNFTYHGLPEKRRAIERDGLITCGDMGYLDEQAYLFLCDRKIDMVISGGVNIYPAEIEAVLIDHPGVADCAVFGIPDDDYGEALAAVVQPSGGTAGDTAGGGVVPTSAELQDFLRGRLSGYKVPRIIEFRHDLPREDSGKIFKRKLRAPYWEKAGRTI